MQSQSEAEQLQNLNSLSYMSYYMLSVVDDFLGHLRCFCEWSLGVIHDAVHFGGEWSVCALGA